MADGENNPEDHVAAGKDQTDTNNEAESDGVVDNSNTNQTEEQQQEEGGEVPVEESTEETKDPEPKEDKETDKADSAEAENPEGGELVKMESAEVEGNAVPEEEPAVTEGDDNENAVPEEEPAVTEGDENKNAVPEEEPAVTEGDDIKNADPTEETKAPEEESAVLEEDNNNALPAKEPIIPAEEKNTDPAEETTAAAEEAVALTGDDNNVDDDANTEGAVLGENNNNAVPAVENAVPAEANAVPAEENAVPSEEIAVPAEETVVPTEENNDVDDNANAEPSQKEASNVEIAPIEEEATEEKDENELSLKKEDEEEKVNEPVQVGKDVSQKPPGSPKAALSDRRPNFNLEATATVKFVLMPSGQVVTLACTLGQTLASLKNHFAYELKMPSSVIMLMFDGKSMDDSIVLADLGVGPNGTIQLEMQSDDPVNTPIRPYRPRQEYHMPDVITVRVMTEDCEAKDVVVEIERSRCKKPYLGGFRNKNTGVEFHNASAQTVKKPRPPPTVERFCRDTQTCEQKNMKQQTTNTTSTQMTGVGVFVDSMEDKLLVPGKYFTADDHLSLLLRNVVILQKYYRRWLAKRYVKQLKEDKAKRIEWERQEELRKKKEKEERIKRDYARRLNPKTKADFDMLIHCLEKWRQEEMERINSTLTGAEQKAALCMLLDQETELLSAIERHKNEANEENKDKRIMAFLDKAAAPKKWQGHDGKLTYMDTPFTIRAKELRDIFNSINMKYLTQDERLDVLLTLKHTVKEHDCKLTQEIIELIDREADLLMRGVKEGNLTGLRKRISTLFLQYIKTPTFNPEAAPLLKVPQDPSTLRKNINYCHSCGNYLPSTDFFITSNSKNVGRCRRCVKIENDGRQREDHTFYRVILKALRKSEEAMQDGSSICFLLQEHDLRYLVENIWSNQSILSAWDDLYDLVLVRWDKHQEWSPWNCILLTHDEAEAHKKLFSLEEGYGHIFIHKVTQKHNFARNYFSRLPGMAELLRLKLGNRDLTTNNGPSVAGQPIAKAQKV